LQAGWAPGDAPVAARALLNATAMPPLPTMTRRTWIAAVVLAPAFGAACGAAPEATFDVSAEALASCAFAVTKNGYDGPNYWGTLTVKNTTSSAVHGLAVSFDVPTGAHCTNDAVPSGAVLSPLSGSGSSATTKSNVCTFTWASKTLAAGASLTFNYSTDSTSFTAATKVKVASASCAAGGSDAGVHTEGGPPDSGPPDSGHSDGASSDSGGGGGDGGVAAIGCNGASGCAVWTKVYQTWYGFNDNSCQTENVHSCNDIAYPGYGPQHHQVATEGKGTFDDPVTAAGADNGCESAGGATLVPGTIIYNPEVHKYFIMEDSCLECTQECNCQSGADGNPPSGCHKDEYRHIDFWMGPNDTAQNASSLNNCEDNLTLGNPYAGPGEVIINPPGDLPVDTTPLYANNSCTAHTYPDPP
jgi:hypothetical protein